MFTLRLVQLIEHHADKLSEGLIARLRRSECCNELLASLPAHETKLRTFEIYRNLTDWLLNKTKHQIEERYLDIGSRRARQGVPFSELLFAIQATKENLWDFLLQEGLLEPGELISEMELLRAMEHFFDHALYFASIGYEGVMHGELLAHVATAGKR
ncbi:MAG: hypothetical protein WAM71_04410 [Candidatus Korobacteraceae bacterium]